MLNYIWLALILLAVAMSGIHGRIKESVDGGIKGAETAVTLALGLVGIMALWLGLMRLAEKAGLVQRLARWLQPVLSRLFPDVPAGHPAMGSMVMNIAANMLGLNNAATPLGLRAMRDLESLNRRAGTATNAMCTFLAINTSSVTLIPVTAVALLAANGSRQPSAIIGTAFLATLCSTIAGIASVKLLQRLPAFALPDDPTPAPTTAPATGPATAPTAATAPTPTEPEPEAEPGPGPEPAPVPAWGRLVLILFLAFFGWCLVSTTLAVPQNGVAPDALPIRAINALSLLAIPFLVAFFPLYAALRGIPVYEEFVEGAKEGFQVAIRIIPFLVAMLVAIGLFRGAGGVDLLTQLCRPVLEAVGFPPELLPMSLMRPLSGSGSFAVFTDLVKTHGADSLIARMAATLYGSTETTFYVIAVYFGAVGVRRTRHAVPAGLIADAVGVVASVVICRLVFA